ncbi:MAG: CRISPR-associated endonuclease Cas3'' [Verrucomicrobia bacterium]|nr:CRISPR-associated endonuclease Cas3'' [Verrucomicrobiota bacterium]
MTYAQFFTQATSHAPYAYQCRLAGGENADPQGGFEQGADCQSQLIHIPTGLGKTSAVVLAWLWNRVHLRSEKWPRRLVYCLPMRTLVEQTHEEAKKWLGDSLWDGHGPHEGKVGLHLLMGGEDSGEWDVYPEENAILIGTQDMLLSRALNRGYGMSRYRWPMHFGLLNNDCLWVMDETQLMGVGVETSAQLDGFRRDGAMSTVGCCPTWWMSATLEDSRLATVDHPMPADGWQRLQLSPEEMEEPRSRPRELIGAKKAVSPCKLSLSHGTKAEYAKNLVAVVIKQHQPGTLTLVVVNRVGRAQEIYEALTTPDKKSKQSLYDPARVALIHSRFRPKDRLRHEELLFGDGDRIVIATQAVEAGVDVSARLLITELAPWSSLVQRIGRCNRRAEYSDAEVIWVDLQAKDATDALLLPYAADDLNSARSALAGTTDASPQSLGNIQVPKTPVVRPVIRRRDLVDLFDTTPDICGQDLDISRYIRDGADSDVQFFWRDLEGDSPADTEPPPERQELCRVSVGDAVKFLGKEKTSAWVWNSLERKWQSAPKPRPGAVYLIAATSGGYDDALGWTGEPKTKRLTTLRPPERDKDAHDSDSDTFLQSWQSLGDHTLQVVSATDALTSCLARDWAEALRTAALWHDVGKAHAEFQVMLRNGDPAREGTLWAKSAELTGKCKRRGFRHELASALAWLVQSPADATDRALVAYLIASHHGKVRLSIRSLPDEKGDPQDPERLFARGIWQGDVLPAVQFDGLAVPETTLDLSFMRMGEGAHGPSWLARTIGLRDRFGPFRLAFLETLLRAADARASRKVQN